MFFFFFWNTLKGVFFPIPKGKTFVNFHCTNQANSESKITCDSIDITTYFSVKFYVEDLEQTKIENGSTYLNDGFLPVVYFFAGQILRIV